MSSKIPLVAFIGIPNSGKSTLLNKITGKKAVTAMEAHTTRDLNYGEEFWDGMYMRFVDTGGLVPDPEDKVQKAVQIRSWGAMARADLLVWVIDRKQDPETISQEILNRVWKTGKPFVIVINKVDDPNLEKDVSEYAFMGGNGFVNISCNTAFGFNTLMDLILENLLQLGFKQNFELEYQHQKKDSKKGNSKKLKNVRVTADGHYYVIRNDSGVFESVDSQRLSKELSDQEIEEAENYTLKKVSNLVFDLGGVLLDFRYKAMEEYLFQNFGLVADKDYDSKKLWEGYNISGLKFEALGFWEKLIENFNLLSKLNEKK